MISLTLANALRENHEEILQLWLKSFHGHVAEDYEQMLNTPMGRAVATSLLNLAVEMMGVEDYEQRDILHRARDAAQDDAFRRTAVGFCLPDLVTNAMAFRAALEETVFNCIEANSSGDAAELRKAIMALNRFGDALIAGQVAGCFAFHKFRENEADNRPI